MPEPETMMKKPKNIKKTIKRFYVEIKPWRKQLIFTIILSTISVTLTVFGPMVLGMITTSATNSLIKGEGILWGEVSQLLLILVLLYVGSSVIGYIQGVLLTRISAKMTKKMRTQILDKISKLPMSYFDSVAGELSNTINEIVISAVTIIGIIAMMLFISVPLSLIALVSIPVSMIFVKKVAEKSQKHFRTQRKIIGNLNSKIEEDYTGQLIIKVNTHEEKTLAEFRKINEELYKTSWKAQFFGDLPFPITHIFTNFAYVLICMLGGYFAVVGRITIGNIQAFIQYVSQFNRPIAEIAQLSATIQKIVAAAQRKKTKT